MSSSVSPSTETPYGGKTRRIVLGLLSVVAVVASGVVAATPVAAKTRAATSTNGFAYTGINPCRVEDTRTDGKTLSAGGTLNVTVAGGSTCSAVPASATAVVLTTTVTDTTASSYVTVFPTGATQPTASNQNWPGAGSTIAAQVTTGVGTGGQVTVFNFAGSADVVLDIAGYFAAPGSGSAGHYVPLGTPIRIADTRNTFQTIAPNSSQDFYIAGAMTPTGAGVAASILNVTVTNTQAPGFLTITPKGSTAATTSMLNWGAGQTIADRYNALLGTGGYITVFNGSAGSTDVVIDGSGYFADNTQAPSTGSLFTPLGAPTRLLDTRSSGSTLGTNSTQTLQVTGANGIPAGATAVVQNLTVTNTNSSSYLEAYPNSKPLVSDVNWQAGWTIANAATTTLNSTGAENLYNLIGNVDVIVDAAGYYTPAPGIQVTANPATVPADHFTTSSIKATVTDSTGNPVVGDAVNFSLSGTACSGTVSANNAAIAPSGGVTDATGSVTATYTPSDVAGTCTVNAVESKNGQTGNVTVTQTAVKNKVTVGSNKNSVPADATTTATLTATVKNGVTSALINGDTVTWTLTANPAGACGSVSPTSGTTDATGTTQTTYTPSTTVGFCKITATESATGGTGSFTITQTVNPSPTNTTTVSSSVNPITADGTSTSTITANVKNGGTNVASDLVHFSLGTPSTTGSCGTLSATDVTTDGNGNAAVTYTASTTAGTCPINAIEANGGSTGSVTETQTAAPNTVSVSSSPSTLPADGTSKSTITATDKTVTGAPQAGATITFSTTGTCGALSAGTATTNSSGVATVTYTAATTPGFCNVKAQDLVNGGSATTTVTQTSAGSGSITLAASKSSVPADNMTTSTLTVTVKSSSGNPINGDAVNLTTSGSPAAACGALSASSGSTNSSGQFTSTYTASSTAGSCTITATEANNGLSTSTTITQTTPPNNVVVAPTSDTQPANGVATKQFTVTVTKPVGGANVVGDTVTASVTGSPSGVCSSSSLDKTSGATNSSGQVVFTYTYSNTVGFCKLTFTESAAGGSASANIDQTVNPTPAGDTVTVANTPDPVVGNGTSTETLTATVKTAGGVAIANDQVQFVLSGANCGTLSSQYATTNASGQASVTYTSKPNTGAAATTCSYTAQEANGGTTSAAGTINQNPQPRTVTVTSSASTLASNSAQTATITATVTDASGNPVAEAGRWNLSANPATACTLAPPDGTAATTNASGQTTATATAGTTSGFCTVTFTDTVAGGSGSVTIRIS